MINGKGLHGMNRLKPHKRRDPVKGIYTVVLLILDILVLAPFAYMLILALMDDNYSPILTVKRLTESTYSLQNFIDVFFVDRYDRYLLNSVIVAALGAFISVMLSTMAAYSFAKKKYRGRKALHTIFSMTMMIPASVMTVPLFLIVKKLGLASTYLGLAVPVFTGAFGTLLIYSFMKGVPDELLESAELDGCGELGKFFLIIIPLVKSAMLSVAIFAIINAWGQLLWPQIIAPSAEMSTITAAISRLRCDDMSNYGVIMAASTIGFVPPLLVYALLQKQFVESIAFSGTKG